MESEQPENVRYACLELRLFLEAVVYAKLSLYRSRLPKSLFGSWQPPKLLKALKQLEPQADQSFTVSISREDARGVATGPWYQLGQQRMLPLQRLTKLYNKLGSYLHLSPPHWSGDSCSHPDFQADTIRGELREIIKELEQVADLSSDMSFGEIVEFPCQACGEVILRNTASLASRPLAECVNPRCGAIHDVVREDGTLKVSAQVSQWKCLGCGEVIAVVNHRMELGYEFVCSSCGVRHEIVRRHWDYRLLARESGIDAEA